MTTVSGLQQTRVSSPVERACGESLQLQICRLDIFSMQKKSGVNYEVSPQQNSWTHLWFASCPLHHVIEFWLRCEVRKRKVVFMKIRGWIHLNATASVLPMDCDIVRLLLLPLHTHTSLLIVLTWQVYAFLRTPIMRHEWAIHYKSTHCKFKSSGYYGEDLDFCVFLCVCTCVSLHIVMLGVQWPLWCCVADDWKEWES